MKSLNNLMIKIGGAVIGLTTWIFIYMNIKSWSDTLVYDILNLSHTNLADFPFTGPHGLPFGMDPCGTKS